MDYNSKNDFNDKKQSNRNNNAYFYNQEQNSDLPYNLINKPKIPMSYYFPEGNQRGNFNKKHSEEEMDKSQHYIQKEPGYYKSNFNKANDDIHANAIQMGGVNMNNINNMNINIYNQVPVNPQNNYSLKTNKNSDMCNESFIENFGGLNVNNESRSHNNPNKKTIAYNYYFGGEGGNNFDLEKEQNVRKDNNYENNHNTSNTINNNNYQYMPRTHSVEYNNFPNHNLYNSNSNNNTPSHCNYLQPSYHDYTHNCQKQNVSGASNMIPNDYPRYNERNKHYESNRNSNLGIDMEEAYLNNKYDNIPRNIQNSSLNMPNQHSARYFILKSVDEENIHKSIKYRIWCSTIKGNQKLQKAFKDADNKYPIYLFFSVNGSGRFLGLAQMTSEVEYRANFNYWTQNEKWRGFFFVVWLIIKDVPNRVFRNLINEYNENKPVTSSRDTQEIQPDAGAEMLRIFKEYTYESSILDEFNFYEKRQGSNNNTNQKSQIKNIPHMEELQNNNQNYANRNNYGESINIAEENTVGLNFNESKFKNPLKDSKYNVGNQNINNKAFGLSNSNEIESNSLTNFPQNQLNSFDHKQRDNIDNLIEKDCEVSESKNKKQNLANQNNVFKEKINRVTQNHYQNNSTKRILKRINSTDNIIKLSHTKNSDEEC